MTATWAAVRRKFGRVQLGLSLQLQRALFQQAVPAAGSYASEVWGLRKLTGDARKGRARLSTLHAQFVKSLLHVPRTRDVQEDLHKVGMQDAEPRPNLFRIASELAGPTPHWHRTLPPGRPA